METKLESTRPDIYLILIRRDVSTLGCNNNDDDDERVTMMTLTLKIPIIMMLMIISKKTKFSIKLVTKLGINITK